MNGSTWLAAAAVSIVAHGAFAALLDMHEVHAPPKRPPVIVHLAPPPKPAPRVEPPPPPPPPPPPKPQLVKKLARTPPPPSAPPPSAAPQIGIAESADASDIAVATGVTQEGTPGTGNSQATEPAPPAPPEPPAPKAAPARQHFVPIFKVTRMPKVRQAITPDVPDAFRQANREALVVVEVELDEHGHVVAAVVIRHAEFGLDDAALAAAKKTEFEPALVGTQAVPVRYQIPYRFRVHG